MFKRVIGNQSKAEVPVSQQQREKYIVALDGLRAIAVLMVLLFHAGFDNARGGFIGVDVFFVISGFLISRNILRDLEQGSFNIGAFYLRRIARLFPALFVVVALTLFIALLISSPPALYATSESSLAALLSLSNILFWLQSGYFDAGADTKPLLHTWSLGVEEQFYLFWPALMIVAFVGRNHVRIALSLVVLGGLSFVSAMAIHPTHPNAVFFLAPFRVFQFAIGALLAVHFGLAARRHNTAGHIIISISLITLTAITVFGRGGGPVLTTMALPALATAMLIWTARTRAAKLWLANKPMVWIGRRSYSIYLVHWPLYVYWQEVSHFDTSTIERGLGIGASILLGALLHKFVESPFRMHGPASMTSTRRVLLALGGLAVVIGVMSAGAIGTNGLSMRVSTELRAAVGDANELNEQRLRALRHNQCQLDPMQHTIEDFDVAACASPPTDRPAYIVIGDSWGGDTYLAFSLAYPEVYFAQLTLYGCRTRLPHEYFKLNENQCQAFQEYAYQTLLDNPNFDGIILSSSWNDDKYNEILQLIEFSKLKNLEVIVVGQHIVFNSNVLNVSMRALTVHEVEESIQKLVQYERRKQDELLAGHILDKARFINFIDLQCPEICEVFDDENRILFVDNSHLTLAGATFIAERMREKYPNLFAQNVKE